MKVMTDSEKENTGSRVIILRLRRCRRSDLIVDFLQKERIPHRIFFLNEDEEAQHLARKFQILASPGIIINGRAINPHQLITKCQMKDRKMVKAYIKKLLVRKGEEDD